MPQDTEIKILVHLKVLFSLTSSGWEGAEKGILSMVVKSLIKDS